MSTDPIEQLTHDHGHLSSLSQGVAQTLVALRDGAAPSETAVDELAHSVELLRDALLAHFAREEEGLFPFVEANVPALAPRVARLLADHDAVIARTTDLLRAVGQAEGAKNDFSTCVSAYDRFVEVYAGHSQTEQSLLVACDEALDQHHRQELRTLLEAI